MDIDKRIAYWRGRKNVAARNGLEKEGSMCDEIVKLLLGARKAAAAAERKVNTIVDSMPVEFTEAAE